ncbi:hypothetical protein C0995_009958 [Termitomyces sp. Mi166|nr:hypothetical protein C0995_009958 [Termitomyces sp. Mi166\
MSTFFATQNARNPRKITLPHLGSTHKRKEPLQVVSGDWTAAHAPAFVPLDIALPLGPGEQNNDVTAEVLLPPASHLIAEVDAFIADQLRKDMRAPPVMIDCQSLVPRTPYGFPLCNWRHWASNPEFITRISGMTESEFVRRLTSVHVPLVIGIEVGLNINQLQGYKHLDCVMPLRDHNCRTVFDLVVQVGSTCEKFIMKHHNDYKGRKGKRVGPGYAPFECVRLIAVLQVTSNHWIGVLSV